MGDLKYPFLEGGGEMGAHIRDIDWSGSSLGTPDKWPLSLRTMIGVVLNAQIPMALYWSNEFFHFHNDSYSQSFGIEWKLPPVPVWKGDKAGPVERRFAEQVLQSGAAIKAENQIVSIPQQVQSGNVNWTIGYSPVRDDEGKIGGVLVTCIQTPAPPATGLQGSAQLEQSVEAGEIGTWSFEPATGKYSANAIIRDWFGLRAGEEATMSEVLELIVEADRQRIKDAFGEAMVYGSGGSYDVEYSIRIPDTDEIRLVHAKGRAFFGQDKICHRLSGTLQDITVRRRARRQLEESEARFQNLIRDVNVGLIVLTGAEMIVKTVNEAYCRIIGHSVEETLKRPLFDVIPDAAEVFMPILQNVRITGKPFSMEGAPYLIHGADGSTIKGFIDFVYQPYREADGSITGVMAVVNEVTEQIETKVSLAAGEAKLRGIVANAPVSIVVMTGRDLIIENPNQIFIDSIGKSWEVVGKPLREAVPELAGQPFLRMLENVYHSGVMFTTPETRVKVERNGVVTDDYYTMSYSRIPAGEGEEYAVLGMGVNVTEQRKAWRKVEESEIRFRSLVEQAPLAICIMLGEEALIEATNGRMAELLGKPPADLTGRSLFAALPEVAESGLQALLQQVRTTGETYRAYAAPFTLPRETGPELVYVDFVYEPYREADGSISGVIVIAADVTRQVLAQHKLEASEAKLRTIVATAPVAIGLFVGRDLVIENPNQTFIDIVGRGWAVEGLPLREAMPELITEGQPFLKILDDIFTTGTPFYSSASLVKIVRNGILTSHYYNISYSPVFNADGEVYAILDVAVDVTEQIEARQKIEESERFTRAIFYNSPTAKLVYVGEEMVLREANEKMLEIFGRGAAEIIGRPIMESIPELQGTPLFGNYQRVLATGETHYEYAARIELIKGGESYWGYYDYTYKALYDADGKIYGVICTAVEVTEQQLAQIQLSEAETSLRSAIELAELGTWSIDLQTSKVHYSEKTLQWLGSDASVEDFEAAIQRIRPEDRERITAATSTALDNGAGGHFDEEYTVVNEKTGAKTIFHSIGKTTFDDAGHPVAFQGAIQDVTIQRELQLALEAQVQNRTEELASAIEELRTTNEELADSNAQLLHSNDELAQYAYVASHDLQEPLRKIRVFTGMLSANSELPANARTNIEKISNSAGRMSLLIQDLLEFSRLLKSDTLMRPVDLAEIVNAVFTDFELVVAEKSAQITIGELPVIMAVGLQMNQLFYNLMSNALKFTGEGVAPQISISSKLISGEELTRFIPHPFAYSDYYEIIFTDNGIGFETQYAEQIFEVFKRLHGRDHYPGSGIGLALCRRIVGNHNGYLYAESKVGTGTTFHIILPVKQYENSFVPAESYQIPDTFAKN